MRRACTTPAATSSNRRSGLRRHIDLPHRAFPGRPIRERREPPHDELDLAHATLAPGTAGEERIVAVGRAQVVADEVAAVDRTVLVTERIERPGHEFSCHPLRGGVVGQPLLGEHADRQRRARDRAAQPAAVGHPTVEGDGCCRVRGIVQAVGGLERHVHRLSTTEPVPFVEVVCSRQRDGLRPVAVSGFLLCHRPGSTLLSPRPCGWVGATIIARRTGSGTAIPHGEPSGDTGPMPDARLPEVPPDWTVWAFSDPHGVTSGLTRALRTAGLIDLAGHWNAPPGTALIGCGDYIDRGGDVPGMVALLRRLQSEARSSDVPGMVALARGNHEVMPLMIRRGELEWLETWLEYGGDATVAAFGCESSAAADPTRMMATLETCAPGLFDWFDSLAHAVRWRDVLFVHGGLAPGHSPDDLGVTTEEHLWVRSGYFDAPWESS